MHLLEGLRDLPIKRVRDKTYNKIKYKQQALITTKIQNIFWKKIPKKVEKASGKTNQGLCTFLDKIENLPSINTR